jgi:hypothetical protein
MKTIHYERAIARADLQPLLPTDSSSFDYDEFVSGILAGNVRPLVVITPNNEGKLCATGIVFLYQDMKVAETNEGEG